MSKLIGLITAWGAEPFIEPAIKQGLEYCDELIVSVSANHQSFNVFADNTMDICQKYGNKIKLIEGISSDNHPNSKGSTLKRMLDETNNNKKGNWIWILDADEFYFERDVNLFKKLIAENKYNRIMMPEKFFMVNMKYYAVWYRDRIKKLTNDNMSFRTNELGNETKEMMYTANEAIGMHHYSFLLNPYFKKAFWEMEYGNPNLSFVRDKVEWLNEIYMKIDLDNQQESVKKCLNMFGIKSILGPIFGNGPWKPLKENSELFKYDGLHPKYIEEAGLTKINDFRKIYEL